ncbi:MAG: ACT domain-containing protein [Clostridia bacterium]|nr:ACT domain-containing protein [Clostridia bacterium]
MIRQLSIFAENKKGAMFRITRALAEAGVNMNTLVTNDSEEYGIIRMLVSDTEHASEYLKAAGYMCHTDWVVATEIGDECGSLNTLLGVLDAANVNLDYLYVTYSGISRRPVAILRAADTLEIDSFLRSRGYNVLSSVE